MKKIIKSAIFLVLLLSFSDNLTAQKQQFDVVRISKISYLKTPYGEVKQQILIELDSNKVYQRKKINGKYKLLETKNDITIFSDITKINKLKNYSAHIADEQYAGLYHNEYGYFKIEFIKLNYQDEIYSEAFLINQPYKTKDDEERKLINEYYELIISLFAH